THKRSEALKRLAAWLGKIDESAYDGRQRALWQEAALHYTTIVMPDNVKPSTATRYLVSLRQVDPFLSDMYVDEIDEAVIGDLVKKRKLDEVTNATIRRELTAVANVLRTAKSEHWCQRNPVANYDYDQIKERRDPIVLPTDAEVDAAIAVVPPMMGHMMRL